MSDRIVATDPKVAREAAALREALKGFNSSYDLMSDADVIRTAAEDGNLHADERKLIKSEFGDSGIGAFARGVGRGFGGDMVLGGIDKVLGTNTQNVLNDPILADDKGMGMLGNVVGSIGGLALPGGAIMKGAKLAKTGMAAAGAYNAASQGYGYQKNELATGERAQLDKSTVAAQGMVGAAGGAVLPKVLAYQNALKAAVGGGGNLLKAGNFGKLARYVGAGAGTAAPEGAAEAGVSTWANDSLHPDVQGRASGWKGAAVQGGLTGAVMGGGFDALDAVGPHIKKLFGFGRSPLNGPGAIVPQAPTAGQGGGQPATAPNPAVPDRTGPSPAAIPLPTDYDPSRLAGVNLSTINQFRASPEYQQSVVKGLANANRNTVERSYRNTAEQLIDELGNETLIDRNTGRVLDSVFIKDSKKTLLTDPVSGKQWEVDFSLISENPFDKVYKNKKLLFGYSAQHQRVPKGSSKPVIHNGQAALPISFSPDQTMVGIVRLNNVQQSGKINAVEMVPIEELVQDGKSFGDKLQASLAEEAAKQEAAKVRIRPKTLDDVDPLSDDPFADWEAQIPGSTQHLQREFQRRYSGVRP